MLDGYDLLLDAIKSFRQKRITFLEFKGWLNGSGATIGYELGYNGRWETTLDAWLEYIEFCYNENDWYDLGSSLADFIEDAILNEPCPLTLPENDRVIKEQFKLETL